MKKQNSLALKLKKKGYMKPILDAVQNAMVTSSHPEFHAEVVVPMSEADAAVAAATYMPLHVTILEFLAFEAHY